MLESIVFVPKSLLEYKIKVHMTYQKKTFIALPMPPNSFLTNIVDTHVLSHAIISNPSQM